MRIRKMKKGNVVKKDLCVLNEPRNRAEKTDKEYKPPSEHFLKRIFSNPNLGFQIMVIIITIASENVQMDRRIEGMTSTVEKIRNITEVLNNTMTSVKAAAEAPRKIRQMLE